MDLDKAVVDDYSLCIFRTFANVESISNDTAIMTYFDIDQEKQEIDERASRLLNHLRDHKLVEKLDDQQIAQFTIDWQAEGINPNQYQAHYDYLQQCCMTFHKSVKGMIDKVMLKVADNIFDSNPLYQEILHHLHFCLKQNRLFYGRQQELTTLQEYLQQTCSKPITSSTHKHKNSPLVVLGPSGCGKTAFIAKGVEWASKHLMTADIIVRFLGHTIDSLSVVKTLTSLCQQIGQLYDQSLHDIPKHYSKLVIYFLRLLALANRRKPLILFLDGLDELPFNHKDDHHLSWLPKQLPPYVAMVISIKDDRNHHDELKALKNAFPTDSCYIELEPLAIEAALQIIDDWLYLHSTTLTPQQRQLVSSAILRCSLPLFIRLLFNQVVQWHSYQSILQAELPTDVSSAIHQLFDRMEDKHGQALFSRTACYMVCSRYGLTANELLDLLSCDTYVMEEIHRYQPTQAVLNIPILIWLRLKYDLNDYIIEFQVDGLTVIRWNHQQIHDIVRQRYLQEDSIRCEIHSQYANYYIGKGVVSSTKGSQYSIADYHLQNHRSYYHNPSQRRSVDNNIQSGNDNISHDNLQLQPMIYHIHPAISTQRHKIRYNLRKLNELPYHLIYSHRFDEVKEMLFCFYPWLITKLQAVSLPVVLDDFELFLSQMHDIEIKIIFDALRLSYHTLGDDPFSLAAELIGQLATLANDDYHYLRLLIESADEIGCQHSPLLPVTSCLFPPGGILRYTLDDCKGEILCLVVTSNYQYIVAGSSDHVVRIWNISSGELMHALEKHTRAVYGAVVTHDCRIVLSYTYNSDITHDHEIIAWNLQTGEYLYNLRGHSGGPCPIITTYNSRYALSGCHHNLKLQAWLERSQSGQDISNRVVDDDDEIMEYLFDHDDAEYYEFLIPIWNLDDGRLDQMLQGHTGEILQICMTTHDRYALSCSRDQTTRMWEIQTGQCIRVIHEPKCHDYMFHLAITQDNRFAIIQGHHLGVYSLDNGQQIYQLQEDNHYHPITRLTISNDDQYVIVCYESNTTEIWNIMTGELICHFQDKASSLAQSSDSDDVYGADITLGNHLVVASGYNVPKIVDYENGKIIGQLNGHASKVKELIVTPESHEPLAITASDDRTIKIWNLSNLDVPKFELPRHKKDITFITICKEKNYYISGSMDNTLKKWDLETGQLLETLTISTGYLYSIHFMLHGQIGYCFPLDTATRVKIDMANFVVTETHNLDSMALIGAHVTTSGEYLVGITIKNDIITWEMKHFKQMAKFALNAMIKHLALVKSKYILTVDNIEAEGKRYFDAKCIHVWDLKTLKLLDRLTGHTRTITCMIKTRNERYLLTGSNDTTVIVWDMENRKIFSKMTAHRHSIKSIAVAIIDNKLIAASGSDRGIVYLWDFHQSECKILYQLEGHKSSVEGLTFALNDYYLISMSTKENILKIWHTKRGYLIANYYLHANPTNFTECAEKNVIIIGLEDGRVMRLKVNQLTDEYLRFGDDQMAVCSHFLSAAYISCT